MLYNVSIIRLEVHTKYQWKNILPKMKAMNWRETSTIDEWEKAWKFVKNQLYNSMALCYIDQTYIITHL